MYYELGTMVVVMNGASPFVNHEKGISIPSNDVIGEIVAIHPTILSYTVRLSKYFTLVFSEDDIYGLPGWMSDKRYLFHKMLGSVVANAHQFYYVKEFENFINREEIERIMAEPVRIAVDDKNIEEIKMIFNNKFGVPKFEYKKIIFSGPCTIILWKDGTKTMAKASSGKEVFDPEKGVAICFMKRALSETEGKKVLRKASKDFYDGIAREANKQLDEELRKATFPLPKGVTFRPFTFDIPMDNNKIIQVKKVDENHKMDFRYCCTCKYASKPVTDKPCSDCASKSHYEKGYENDKT